MRSKVMIVRGSAGVAKRIALGEYERVNADHVVAIAVLRRPQYLPPDFVIDLGRIEADADTLLELLVEPEPRHFLVAQYAAVVTDLGIEGVRVVEGNALRNQWFYEAVRMLHRQFNQVVIDCEVKAYNDQVKLVMDGREMPVAEAVAKLNPRPNLG